MCVVVCVCVGVCVFVWLRHRKCPLYIFQHLSARDHLPDITSALEGSGFEESSDKRSATSYVKVLLQTLRRMVEAGGDSLEVRSILCLPSPP